MRRGREVDQDERTVLSIRPQKSRRSVVRLGLSEASVHRAGGIRSGVANEYELERDEKHGRTSSIIQREVRVLNVVEQRRVFRGTANSKVSGDKHDDEENNLQAPILGNSLRNLVQVHSTNISQSLHIVYMPTNDSDAE